MPGTTVNTRGTSFCVVTVLRISISTYELLDTIVSPEMSSIGLKCHERYLVLFIDLDAMIPNTKIETIVLHWYQPDLVFNCTEKGPLKPANHRDITYDAPYIPPQPPPTSHHRYLYLLFQQPSGYMFPECFSHIPPKTVQARAGFDLREFMAAASLDQPVALNYFIAQMDVPDGADPPSLPTATTTSFRSVLCTKST